jgi:anthranilate phosphoribosyltransferase
VPRATALLSAARCRALVFRGVDGEPALHPHAQRTVWRVDPSGVDALDLLPELAPDPAMVLAGGATAAEVARWSAAVVAGRSPMPTMTRRLVGLALDLAGSP